jgi:Histone deacetylase complex, SIN3 component
MGKLTSPQAGAAEALYSVRLRDKVKVDDDPVTMLPEYSTAEALTPLSKLRPDAAHDVLHHSSNSSATPSSKGVAASKKVLDDAFVFVDRAKEKCKPDVYERFLEILKGFKQGK